MDTQTWTLIGIVVGAVLGGVAQIIAGSVQQSFDRARVVRDFRREAYGRFLHAAIVLVQMKGRWAVHRSMEQSEQTMAPDEESPSLEALDRVYQTTDPVLDAGFSFQDALLQVEIVAPGDTFEAAQKFFLRLSEVVQPLRVDDDVDADEEEQDASEERKAFLALAKRDIGLSARSR